MIPNLARYIGPTKLTSPRIPYLTETTEYAYRFTTDAGNTEAFLTFPPHGTPGYSWNAAAVSDGLDEEPQASKSLVVSAGGWYVDTDTGLCYFYDTIQSNWELTYRPVVDGDLGSDAGYNIVPDPDTDTGYAFLGLKIAYKNGTDNSEGYYVWLPPRGPLDTRATTRAPQNIASNFSSTPDSTPVNFWQDDNVAATTGTYAEHYRYQLPTVITGATGWGQGASLPKGLMYLWDHSGTGTILEGTSFFADDIASPTKYKFIVNGQNLDTYLSTAAGLAAYPVSRLQDTSTHTAAHYPSTGLRLVTISTDISKFLATLMTSYLQHDHGSSSSLPTKPVKHSKTQDLFGDDDLTPRLDPSKLSYDDHPQYLHRGGFGGTTTRDKFGNAMLGNMLIASTDSTNNYMNFDADSHRLYFGQVSATDAGYIYMDHSAGRLVLHGRKDGGTQGISIGDSNESAINSLLITNNGSQSFYMRPVTNNSSSNVYIDGYDLNLGTQSQTTNVVIGRSAGSVTVVANSITLSSSTIRRSSKSRTYAISLNPMSGMAQYVDLNDVHPSLTMPYVGLTDGTNAKVPWTIIPNGVFVMDPGGDTSQNFQTEDLWCFSDSCPEGLITNIQIDWDTNSASCECHIYRRSFAGGGYLLGSFSPSKFDLGRKQPNISMDDGYGKATNTLAFRFVASDSQITAFLVYPVARITVESNRIDPYEE